MRSPGSKRKFLPQLETLEDRTTATVTVTPDAGTLALDSNNRSDRVSIQDNGDGDLRVSFNGGSFRGNNYRRIRISMRSGDDRVTYLQTGIRTRDMTIEAQLGAGADLFQGSIQGNINAGAFLDIDVRGAGGADSLELTANADVDVAAGASFVVRLSGGDDTDRVDFNYQGEMDGILRYTLSGDSGNDNNAGFLRATVRADTGSSGVVGIAGEPALVEGGFEDDNLGYFIFKSNPADTLGVFAKADGGIGTDICNRTGNVTGNSCESDFVM